MKEKWLRNYHLLEKYYQKHGNINVPYKYEIDGVKLGIWLANQRLAYNKKGTCKITQEQIELLNKFGIKWNVRERNWDNNYRLLEEYYQKHGNINVPYKYEVDGVKLGVWLANQRLAYNKKGTYKITKKQIELLNKLGIKWNVREENWDNNYYLLEKYYQKHGNINVPYKYEVDGVKLGVWVATQRLSYIGKGNATITNDQIMLLNDLNMDWSPKNTKILNKEIDADNIENYNKLLIDRVDHIIDDLVYEGINDIDLTNQGKIEKIMIKRIWR